MYHITNGDSLTERLKTLNIEGDIITMRECLMEGPKDCSDGFEAFFKAREAFIYTQFGNELSYEEYVVAQFRRMREIPEGSEVCFWFEDDLFCQANWWFLLYYLKDSKTKKHLIRSGDASPYSFARLGDNALLKAYEAKEEIVEQELTALWELYVNDDEKSIEALPESFLKKYYFVKPAFRAHIDRLPQGNSLGKPKEVLKEIGEGLGFENFGKLFQEFKDRLPIYGYGDLQVQHMLKELKQEN